MPEATPQAPFQLKQHHHEHKAHPLLYNCTSFCQLTCPERVARVQNIVAQMEHERFGSCTNHGECEAACPKGVSLDFIAIMNR